MNSAPKSEDGQAAFHILAATMSRMTSFMLDVILHALMNDDDDSFP